MARSTSSNSPRAISSGLPPRNSSSPACTRPCRYSTSTYSSAGTAKSTMDPERSRRMAGIAQRGRRAHQPGDLRVVPAGMRRVRFRVLLRVAGHRQRVQFTDQRQRGTGTPRVDAGLDPGSGQSRAVVQFQLIELALDQRRGLELFEAQFRVAHDCFADFDDVVAVRLNNGGDALFQIGAGGHTRTPRGSGVGSLPRGRRQERREQRRELHFLRARLGRTRSGESGVSPFPPRSARARPDRRRARQRLVAHRPPPPRRTRRGTRGSSGR